MPRSALLSRAARARPRRTGWPARVATHVATFGGVLAVLLQGALPIAHQAGMTMPDPHYADYRSAFGAASEHALCAIDVAPDDGRPAKPGSSDQALSCPLCLAALQATGWLPRVGVTPPVPPHDAAPVALAAVVAWHPAAIQSDAQARAPPRLI
jgi:hypothetical protein